jgi:UDP-glucose 4-epimerase
MTNAKRYLITGGAGFVGSHLAEQLLAAGASVMILDDLSTGRIENLRQLQQDSRFYFVQGSAENKELVQTLAGRCDAIYHLAAALGVKLVVEHPTRVIETTIHSTEVVLEAAARFDLPVLLTSSSEVYGKTARVPFREDDDVVMGPTRVSRWCYAYSKAVGEFLALAYHKERGLPVRVVRLFNTVGPRQIGCHGMVLPRFVRAAVRGEPLEVYGDGKQTRCFCHVRDVAGALVRLLDSPDTAGEVYNVGSDEEISIEALARRVIKLAESTSCIEQVPYRTAYGTDFDDPPRRLPSLDKLRAAVGFERKFSIDDIIRGVIDYERDISTSNGSSKIIANHPRVRIGTRADQANAKRTRVPGAM